MKTLTILLAIISLSLAGDLKLSCDVEPAWVPRAASSEYLTPKEIKYMATDNVFCLTLKPAFGWKFLYGWFEFSAFSASPKSGSTFVPIRISYSNEIGLKHSFSSFTISGGLLRNCQHQIMVAAYRSCPRTWNDFGYDKIFLRFSYHN